MKNPVLWLALVIVIGVLGYFLVQGKDTPTETAENAPPTVMPVEPPGFETGGGPIGADVSPQTNTVYYTDTGFSPKTLTVSLGTSVTFINQSTGEMWVGVDDHPSHTGYDGTSRSDHCVGGPSVTSFDQCESSDTYSFTFNKVGTWEYHNHRGAADGGTIIVTQ